jgi:Caspase domain
MSIDYNQLAVGCHALSIMRRLENFREYHMVEEDRKLAIAIGVAGSVPPNFLTGAINGARAFQKWASQQGYETTLVTDSQAPVTMQMLRERMEALLTASPKPIFRIIVYFAGHGLIRELEEGLWLLSDWRNELRAVAVEVLKRRLSMYGPRQVCIISDACRSLPANVLQADLVPDAVLGAGPRPANSSVAIDKFIATQDGQEAFMIPGADPGDDRCLFSGVLIEGLWGQAGLTESPFSRLEPDKITGRSLGAYLAAEAPLRARNYGLSLIPTISPTFPEGYDDYFRKGDGSQLPTFPPWPPQDSLAAQGVSAGLGIDALAAKIGALSGSLKKVFKRVSSHEVASSEGGGTVDRFELEDGSTGIVEHLRAQVLPRPGMGFVCGITVSGRSVTRLWLGDGGIAQPLSVGSWSVTLRTYDHAASPGLMEFSDGLFASIVVLPRLFTSLVRERYGIAGILYRDLEAPEEQVLPTEDALKDLDRGELRSDAAVDMAAQLREGKHADPILGVISAYLYDAIGDIDNIRRMASFYAMNGEAIPYDIALLGGLEVSGNNGNKVFVHIPAIKARAPRTAAERAREWTHCAVNENSGLVAGIWPWMRQGWTYLDHPSDVGSSLIIPGLIDLRSGLMRSRFTTFEESAGRAAASLLGLNPQV